MLVGGVPTVIGIPRIVCWFERITFVTGSATTGGLEQAQHESLTKVEMTRVTTIMTQWTSEEWRLQELSSSTAEDVKSRGCRFNNTALRTGESGASATPNGR